MSKLFSPLKIGDYELNHRVIMAPLTRFRAPDRIPGDLMATYYHQRASKGGLIIAESTGISETCGVPLNMPRIDTPQSMEGWKKVVEAVHQRKGIIFCQLNHFGRGSVPEQNGNDHPVISSYSIPISGDNYRKPKPMDENDMDQVIDDFVNAASLAIEAGFDGVELHGANGYLLDQFLEDNINKRTDSYGGSIENRSRFPLKVLDSVIKKIGPGKIGYRISPWDVYQDANDSSPLENFSYFCKELEKRNLAYVHCVEARSDANGGRENDNSTGLSEEQLISSVSCLKKYLPTTPLISAGGWNRNNAKDFENLELDGLAFGRYFISNPDLPTRLELNVRLNHYDRNTFYTPLTPVGYTDYPFL